MAQQYTRWCAFATLCCAACCAFAAVRYFVLHGTGCSEVFAATAVHCVILRCASAAPHSAGGCEVAPQHHFAQYIVFVDPVGDGCTLRMYYFEPFTGNSSTLRSTKSALDLWKGPAVHCTVHDLHWTFGRGQQYIAQYMTCIGPILRHRNRLAQQSVTHLCALQVRMVLQRYFVQYTSNKYPPQWMMPWMQLLLFTFLCGGVLLHLVDAV